MTANAYAMQDDAEFAAEYTAAERVRFVVIGVVIGAAVVATGKLWLFPWFAQFSASAPCRSVLGVSGVAVLFYGLFVGIPVSSAILVASTLGLRGYRILRDRRIPPVGEKVFRPTRIERGTKAKVLGCVHVLAGAPLVALAIWGYFQAGEMAAKQRLEPPKCVAMRASWTPAYAGVTAPLPRRLATELADG